MSKIAASALILGAMLSTPAASQDQPSISREGIELFAFMVSYNNVCSELTGEMDSKVMVSVSEAAKRLGYDAADKDHLRLMRIKSTDHSFALSGMDDSTREIKCLEAKIVLSDIAKRSTPPS